MKLAKQKKKKIIVSWKLCYMCKADPIGSNSRCSVCKEYARRKLLEAK